MILEKFKERESEIHSEQEEKVLLTFLKRTKDGKYATIDKSSLAYPRVKEQRELSYNEEEYYYSLR